MTEANQPLSKATEEFLREVTKDLPSKPSILSAALERSYAKQRERQEIENLPEPERTFKIMAYNQTNFTFAYGIPNLRKMKSEGMLAVVRSPIHQEGFKLGYRFESFQIRDSLHVPDYKDTFYEADVSDLKITQSGSIFEAEPEKIVVNLFAAVLTAEEKKFLIDNTSRI